MGTGYICLNIVLAGTEIYDFYKVSSDPRVRSCPACTAVWISGHLTSSLKSVEVLYTLCGDCDMNTTGGKYHYEWSSRSYISTHVYSLPFFFFAISLILWLYTDNM